jgi:hypothetical protein
MRLWIDDVRPAPEGYVWCKSVNDAKRKIEYCESWLNSGLANLIGFDIELIDIDHDAGNYASDGGDYIRLLDWLEEIGRDYPIRIHSQNPVGVENMRRIIQRNGWKEIR